jgi:ABC-type phosphate/phosphonate transport system substrate-binding protein
VFFGFKEKPKMKKQLMALVGMVAVCMLLAVVSNVMAADANQPKQTPREKGQTKDTKLVIGIVSAVKDNDGNITEIKVTAHKDLIYKVVLDEKGIELGKTMADKKARIEGLIEVKGNVHWLTVKTFGEVKAKTEANPKPKPPTSKPRQN